MSDTNNTNNTNKFQNLSYLKDKLDPKKFDSLTEMKKNQIKYQNFYNILDGEIVLHKKNIYYKFTNTNDIKNLSDILTQDLIKNFKDIKIDLTYTNLINNKEYNFELNVSSIEDLPKNLLKIESLNDSNSNKYILDYNDFQKFKINISIYYKNNLIVNKTLTTEEINDEEISKGFYSFKNYYNLYFNKSSDTYNFTNTKIFINLEILNNELNNLQNKNFNKNIFKNFNPSDLSYSINNNLQVLNELYDYTGKTLFCIHKNYKVINFSYRLYEYYSTFLKATKFSDKKTFVFKFFKNEQGYQGEILNLKEQQQLNFLYYIRNIIINDLNNFYNLDSYNQYNLLVVFQQFPMLNNDLMTKNIDFKTNTKFKKFFVYVSFQDIKNI